MTFNEWIKSNSLFSEIFSIKDFEFITIHTASTLDLSYKLMFGNKKIPSIMEVTSCNEIAKILVMLYGDKWDKTYNILKHELLLGVESKKVIDYSKKDDENSNTNTDNVNKIPSYNDAELIIDNTSNDVIISNKSKITNDNTVETIISNKVLLEQMKLFSNSFIDDVLKDIDKSLSLKIY